MIFCFLMFAITLIAEESVVSLGDLGSIRYKSNEHHLVQIERLSPSEEVMYTHCYEYDETGRLISEKLIGDLGDVFYTDETIISPFSLEICQYDNSNNLIKYSLDGVTKDYSYNAFNQMITPDGEQCEYDNAGNIISSGENRYIYDENNHLIEVVTPTNSIHYTYDSYGNRHSRTVDGKSEYYLYQGINEIAIVDGDGKVDQIRIPGLSTHPDILRAVAIETKTGIYAPIHDVVGNIIRLIDISTKKVISFDSIDPYGRNLSIKSPTPWIFSGKYYDAEANLVYFGNRYYAPALKKWLTKDPLKQSIDLHQFCLDNPFAYIDPDGRWAIPIVSIFWGAGVTFTCPLWAPYAAASAVGMIAGYYAYEAYDDWQRGSNKTKQSWEADVFSGKIDAHKAKEGIQKDGAPKSNIDQNRQATEAKKEIERKLGKKLSKSEQREFHDLVTGKNYNYHELVEEGFWLFYER